MAQAYQGMSALLATLKARGKSLGLATLKNEIFAAEMLKNLGLVSYFDAIRGMDQGDTLTKAQLLKRCMEDLSAPAGETILVGDSEYDALGALETGIDFLAVTYGYGFPQGKGLGSYQVRGAASSPAEVALLV